jgi:hypothetical protein
MRRWHYLFGNPWQTLLADYNLFEGLIWFSLPIVSRPRSPSGLADSDQLQIPFVRSLTAYSVFDLAANDNMDYACNSFESAFKKAIFINARRM